MTGPKEGAATVADNEQDAPAAIPSRTVVFTPIDPSVDALTFKAFIEEKANQYKCPICGNASYSVLQFFEPNKLSLIALPVMNTDEPNNSPLYHVSESDS